MSEGIQAMMTPGGRDFPLLQVKIGENVEETSQLKCRSEEDEGKGCFNYMHPDLEVPCFVLFVPPKCRAPLKKFQRASYHG